MPTYVFQCKSCKKVFDELCRFDDRDSIRCPDCKNTEAEQLITMPRAVVFNNPRGTSKEDNFDYVARWNMDDAKDLRRRAEEASKGDNPYNSVDDISSGEYFGEVK